MPFPEMLTGIAAVLSALLVLLMGLRPANYSKVEADTNILDLVTSETEEEE